MPLNQIILLTEFFVQNRMCARELFSKVSKILFCIFTAAILDWFLNHIILALKIYIDNYIQWIQSELKYKNRHENRVSEMKLKQTMLNYAFKD